MHGQDRLKTLIEELKKRQSRPKYVPTNKETHNQLRLHQSTKRIRLAFGGNQSGKSIWTANECVWWALGKHPYRPVPEPPCTIWVISTEYTTILSGVYRHICEYVPDYAIESWGPKVQGHDMKSYIKFKNGSKISFMSAKGNEEARTKFQAAKVHLLAIDEEIGEVFWEELTMRQVAAKGAGVIISATLVKSEPWVIKLENKALLNDPEVDLERFDTESNPYVDREILDSVIKDMDQETIEYRIKGKSRRYRGLVYKAFDPNTHVIDPFDIPQHWPIFCGLDPGLRIFGVLWIAVDPEGHKYAIDELYLEGAPLHYIVDAIREKERWALFGKKQISPGFEINRWRPGKFYWRIENRVIDDKRGQRTLTGELGVLEQLANIYGVYCVPAFKSIQIGIERCRQSLRLLEDGQPEFCVFNNCHNFIYEIQNYRYKPDKTKITQNAAVQEPVRKNNHLLDCWRYLMIQEPTYTPFDIDINIDEEVESSVDFSIHDLRRRQRIKELKTKVKQHEVLGSEMV